MKHDISNIGLLPAGFVDLMPEDAKAEANAIQTLMALFETFGYQRIKPPLLEFEESLLAPGPGASLANDTFRVMDPASHKMMGLRADITPQIARIVKSRFEETSQAPLRLTYANDVLRTRSGQLRTARQFAQVGCEFIYGDDVDSTAELCLLAALGLQKLGVEGITIDITIPRLVDVVLQNCGLNDAEDASLREALRKREQDAIDHYDIESFDFLRALMIHSGDLKDALDRLDGTSWPDSMSEELAQLKILSVTLPRAFAEMGVDDVRLSFDPLETQGFEYHNGIAFSIFADGMRGELGRGGQYDLNFGAADADTKKAKGFTLYMDTILSGLSPKKESQTLAVMNETPWSEVKRLQEEGWCIVRFASVSSLPNGCTHVLRNSTIETL